MLLIEGSTGFVLLHADALKSVLDVSLPAWVAPWREQAAEDQHGVTAIAAGNGGLLVARGNQLFAMSKPGAGVRPQLETVALGTIHALSSNADALFLGHERGLARCDRELRTCRELRTSEDAAAPDVRGIARALDELVVSTHHEGLWKVDLRREPLELIPWVTPTHDPRQEMKREKDPLAHLHGVAVAGSQLWAASQQGVLTVHLQTRAVTARGLSARNVESVAVDASGVVWAAVAPDKRAEEQTWLYRLRPDDLVWDPVDAELLPALDLKPVLAGDGNGRLYAAFGERIAHVDGPVVHGSLPLGLPRASGTKPVTAKAVIDDLHTGHAFGLTIRLLYDLTALGILVFVLSGIHMWWTPRRLKRLKERQTTVKPAAAKASTAAS